MFNCSYLFHSQVLGESNPEAYNRALRAGCRVVELDCYDGDDGKPIVTHGHTFVKSCLFESIIRFIEQHLFKASPYDFINFHTLNSIFANLVYLFSYPVILTIENHCSNTQQKEMTRILKEVLGGTELEIACAWYFITNFY